ncbi:MAG: DUF1501 domain-containing protein [Pirellulales bacterium]
MSFAPLNRREMLQHAGCGVGMLALAQLCGVTPSVRAGAAQPLSPTSLHFPPRARSCIFLYMPGGPSQIDLFDPKPQVTKRHGQPLPIEKPKLMHSKTVDLFGSPWKFDRHGQSGIEVSRLLPHIARHVDDLCVVRSMVADNINHTGAALQMNTGEQAFSRPSLGSWVTYGLGSENDSLPGYVVIAPNPPFQGAPLWSSSFLPAAYQGTWIQDLNQPVSNLRAPNGDLDWQRQKLDALNQLNREHLAKRPFNDELEARIASFELAFRMQMQAPEAFDLAAESTANQTLYGLDDPATEVFGRQCLLARRLVERGVRFVQLYDTGSAGGPNSWDHHGGIPTGLPDRCRGVDQPIAGLLADLKQRGLLEETLVVWGGEFGRTPTREGTDGRGHHPFGFTMFLAGGGVRGGHIHGATDDFGWWAVEDKVHVHDLHATILYLMGIDHKQLIYRFGGRDYRLTDVHGNVVHEIIV